MKLTKYISEVLEIPESVEKLISQAEVISYNGMRAVKKVFTDGVGLIKWLPPATLFRAAYPFTLDPRERFERELRFFELGRNGFWKAFATPKVLYADVDSLTLIREYVDGARINYRKDAEVLARALAEVHSKNYVLGDVKPTNFIVGRDNVLYVIDAEQSIMSSNVVHKAWDIALTFFFMSYVELLSLTEFKELARVFLRTYLSSGGDAEVIREVTNIRLTCITLLIPLPHLILLGDVMDEVLLSNPVPTSH